MLYVLQYVAFLAQVLYQSTTFLPQNIVMHELEQKDLQIFKQYYYYKNNNKHRYPYISLAQQPYYFLMWVVQPYAPR